MNVVFNNGINQRGLLEEVILLESMEFVEFHAINTQRHIHRRFQQEVLVALIGNHLYADMLQTLEILTSELLDESFRIGFHLTSSTHAIGCTLC